MKKIFFLLLMVLSMQVFNSCTHDSIDDDQKANTEQTDSYCCGDDVNEDDGDG